jgi:hypothetical protein
MIVQRGDRAFGRSPLDATLDRLMMQSEPASHRKSEWERQLLSATPVPGRLGLR